MVERGLLRVDELSSVGDALCIYYVFEVKDRIIVDFLDYIPFQ